MKSEAYGFKLIEIQNPKLKPGDYLFGLSAIEANNASIRVIVVSSKTPGSFVIEYRPDRGVLPCMRDEIPDLTVERCDSKIQIRTPTKDD